MTGYPRRTRRWIAIIGLGLVLVLSAGFAYLRVKLEGPDLGDKIASILNKRMRGRIEIGSVAWPTSALQTMITGGWVRVEVRDVKVWDDCALSAAGGDADELRGGTSVEDCTPDDKPDPDPSSRRKPRKLLLASPLLTAEIDVHAAMFGQHDLVFRNVTVHGGEALIEQVREPYPLHAYNRSVVSILTAFYPRMKAGFRDGIYADSAPPTFDLRDMHVEGVNVTVHVAPYTLSGGNVGYGMTARIEGVNVDVDRAAPPTSFLYMDATDPLVAKFYVRLALSSKHGRVRLLDEGPRAAFHIPGSQGLNDDWAKQRKARYELEVADLDIKRLAQLPTDWPRRDYVANTLEVDATVHTIPCTPDARPEDRAELHFSGELRDYSDRPYDGQWNFGLDVKNFGPTLHTCIKRTMGGDKLGGRIAITGPFVTPPKVTLDLHDLDYDLPLSAKEEPLHLTLAEVHGQIDLVNEEGSIDKTKALVEGGKQPGEVLVSATFGLKPLIAHADIDITKPIEVGRFLPRPVATSVGKFLSGHLRAGGDVEEGFELTNVDLSLGMTPKDRSLRVYNGRLFAKNEFDDVDIQYVRVEAGRSHALIDGGIEYVHDHFEYKNLTIEGDFPDLDVWLKRFGLPPVASSAQGGVITLNGPLKNPKITANTTLAGIPCIGTLNVRNAVVQNGIVDVLEMSTTGLGGTLTGSARVDTRAQQPVIEKFKLVGTGIDAAKLCGFEAHAKGTLQTAQVEMSNVSIDKNRPLLDWLDYTQMYVEAGKLSVYGDNYSDAALCLNRPSDDKCRRPTRPIDADVGAYCDDAKKAHGKGFCAVARATRDRGGQLDATIIDVPGKTAGIHSMQQRHLGGLIAVDGVPLAVLDPWVGPKTLGGLFSATLRLSGSPAAPQAEGALDLLRGWVGNSFLGDSYLSVSPIMVGRVPGLFVRGKALADQVEVSATIGTAPPFPVDVSVSGRRVEVDPFIDVGKKLGLADPVQLWASGTVTVHTELAPANGKPQPEAWVEVTELEAIVDHRTADGRLTPISLKLVQAPKGQYAMSLRVTPSTLELACRNANAPTGRSPCPAKLETPAGIVQIEGSVNQAQMALHASGELDLAQLGPLLENQLDSISGGVTLSGNITGTFGKPSYDVALDIAPKKMLRVRPLGSDTEVQVPSGQIKIANGVLGFNSLTLRVRDDRHPEEQGQLVVHGTMGLGAGMKPSSWGILIDGGEDKDGNSLPGRIPGKLLLVLAPNAVSQASGLASLDGALVLSGTGLLPKVDGAVVFDPVGKQSPISVNPRGVRRELALLGGGLEIRTTDESGHRTYAFRFNENPLTASIDGEGLIQNIRGGFKIRDNAPSEARIELDAQKLPFKVPGSLELSITARDILLELDAGASAWRASGDISIVDGRYQRNFDLTEVIKPQPAVVAPAKPIWDEFPSIGNADLDLTLDVRKFVVDNNIAQIDLEGQRILISGSPRDPRLSGSIRVVRGDFQITGTRARFTRTTGSIDFAENDKAANPHLDVTSVADYLDLSGQQHLITLSLFGTLEQPQWDLKTSTGYDKSQTLALLFLGRNPEQLRRSLGDQALGRDPTRVDPSTNPSTGFADQVVKDLAGQWISDRIGDSLTRQLHLDVLRFEIGFGTAGVHAELKIVENIKALGDAELTIRGNSLNVRANARTPWHITRFLDWNDSLSAEAGLLQKNFLDPAELDYTDAMASVVYRLFIP